MRKWADYLISKVKYDKNHLVSVAIRHKDTLNGITEGKPIDRLSISSDIKNGLVYITIYSGNNSWKKGNKIRTFSINGFPYLRIDKNKDKLDYFGDLPEPDIEEEATPEQLAKLEQLEQQIQELESRPEPDIVEESVIQQLAKLEQLEQQIQELESRPKSTPIPVPRGLLPKDTSEELSQELDLSSSPEPDIEEEATPEQLTQLDDLQNQINELEDLLSFQNSTISFQEATPEQLTQLDDLQNQINELEQTLETAIGSSNDNPNLNYSSSIKKLEQEIKILEEDKSNLKLTKRLQKQNKKLNEIEKKISNIYSNSNNAYCVKCKTKRSIQNPEKTVMKNGRTAITGTCEFCNCKVFRIGKISAE